MGGGLRAWKGIHARGFPEQLTVFFEQARSTAEYLALAAILEEGMGEFYRQIAAEFRDAIASEMFARLALREEQHKSELARIYAYTAGSDAKGEFPFGIVSESVDGKFIEGAIPLHEALEWMKGRQIDDVLELCIALETTSYDRYIVLAQSVTDPRSRDAVKLLAREERSHIREMTEMFENLQAEEGEAAN